MHPAILWKRVLAYFIDMLIIGVITSPFSIGISNNNFSDMYTFFSSNLNLLRDLIAVEIVIAFVALLYFVLLEFKLGQTMGKMLLNIFVMPIDKAKGFTLNQIVLRNISKVFTLLLVIDTSYIFLRHTHQRYSEKISGTQVVQAFRRIL